MPPKGMTLPFLSYGGSSLLSLALGMGFLVAATRKRPRAEVVMTRRPRPTPDRSPRLPEARRERRHRPRRRRHRRPSLSCGVPGPRAEGRGFRVELISDERVAPFAATFPADAIHRIVSGTVTGAGLLGKAKGVLSLGRGLLQSRGLIARIRPAAVVGFGGYPSVPPVLAASLMRLPTVLHEQNAVMGRANRFLSARVSRVASGFPIAGAVHVGNPVRQAVIEAAAMPYPDLAAGGPCRCSSSAAARARGSWARSSRPPSRSSRRTIAPGLRLVQQVRQEDMASVQAEYARLGVAAECNPFFRDLPARLAQSHLVVARSGASTVASSA